jgi:hypothetical protein
MMQMLLLFCCLFCHFAPVAGSDFADLLDKKLTYYLPYNPTVLALTDSAEEFCLLAQAFPKGQIWEFSTAPWCQLQQIHLLRLNDSSLTLCLSDSFQGILSRTLVLSLHSNLSLPGSLLKLQSLLWKRGFRLIEKGSDCGALNELVFIQDAIYSSIYQ